jgi:hypothetical protein
MNDELPRRTAAATKASTQPAQSESATEQVKERVQDATAKAKRGTREQLRAQLTARSTQMGEQLTGTVAPMRRAADQLRSEQREAPAKLIEGVTDRTEGIGRYLMEADGDRILRDVDGFARRQPWLTVTGSMVAGFFASRFVKASSSNAPRPSNEPSRQAERAPALPQATGALEEVDLASAVPVPAGGGSAA